MNEYKVLIGKFLEELETLDIKCKIETFNNDELYLCQLIHSCRNKLAEIYNKIDDDDWIMPDTILR